MSELHLAIVISRTSVHVAEVLRSSNTIKSTESGVLEKLGNSEYKDQLNTFFDTHSFDANYKDVTVAWADDAAFFTPVKLYQESDLKTLGSLMFGKDVDQQELDFNRLSEIDLVSVYQVPVWVKSFFVRKFPYALIQHEQTMIHRALFQGKTFDRKIVFRLLDNYFGLSVIEQNKIIFSNNYTYKTISDIIYYFNFAVIQLDIQHKGGSIEILTLDPYQNKAEEVVDTLIKQKLLKGYTKESIPNSLHKLQLLCV